MRTYKLKLGDRCSKTPLGSDRFTIHFSASRKTIPADLVIDDGTHTWNCYLRESWLINDPPCPRKGMQAVQLYRCIYQPY